jgi:transposase
MRGQVNPQGTMFYTINVESLVPAQHPLRGIKARVDAELRRLSPAFKSAYSEMGRPSIPPERLLKAMLLQALYSVESDDQICEQIAYNLLYRWFLDLTPEDSVWDSSTFTRTRERFARHGLMQKFFEGSVAQAIAEDYAGSEHFSVDGTLIQAWGSMKSFRPKEEKPDKTDEEGPTKPSNRWVNWHGEKRSNETHESKTDPEARLARKGPGQSSMLAHSMHVLMDNRQGLVLDLEVSEASGGAEREATPVMLKRVRKRHFLKPTTLGADKGYDDGGFLSELERDFELKPHVAIREGAIRAKDVAGEARRRARRRSDTVGYGLSQRVRKRIEEIFGWMKETAKLRKARFVGRWKIKLQAQAAGAAYNFIRMAKLEAAA